MKSLSILSQEKEIIPCLVSHGTCYSAKQLDPATFLSDSELLREGKSSV